MRLVDIYTTFGIPGTSASTIMSEIITVPTCSKVNNKCGPGSQEIKLGVAPCQIFTASIHFLRLDQLRAVPH